MITSQVEALERQAQAREKERDKLQSDAETMRRNATEIKKQFNPLIAFREEFTKLSVMKGSGLIGDKAFNEAVQALEKGEASALACENCKFTMPNGVTGEASSIAFDSSSGLLTLSGSEENPVKLTMTNGGTFSITANAILSIFSGRRPSVNDSIRCRMLGA